ncbi:MAG: DUF3857 domain-containing protein [Spirochaetales bacterium]|nr:DUF3857 domain-containing protein [Spirochaetales bacterium]
MRRFWAIIFVLWSGANSLWAIAPEVQARQLWGQGLFQASAKQVLDFVATAQFYPDQPAVIFYERGTITFSPDGTETRQSFWVYRIQSLDAVNSWGQIKISWSPWHEERPVIKGRVINPDGNVWPLDPSALVEVQNSANNLLYSDSKTIQAPYPHVVVGSVIEEEVTTVSHPLLPHAGVADQWQLGSSASILAQDISISVPAQSPFHLKVYGTSAPSIVQQDETSRHLWHISQGPIPGSLVSEENLPRNAVTYPGLAFSTAPDWGALASEYSQQINQKLLDSTVKLPTGIVTTSLPETAAHLMQWINRKVRYVGLELGENSIVPYLPQTILNRGYGDCKDKAVLLTALLRLAGYPAHVALLWDGSNRDIPKTVPGLDWFDHAIVYVGGSHPLWLDPTSDFSRGTLLPASDQERWALVAAKETRNLLQTPLSSPLEQENTETRVYDLKDSGTGNVTETTVYSGGFELYYRQHYALTDPADIKKDLANYADKTYAGATLGSYNFSDPRDLAKPFTFTIQLKDTDLAITDDNQAVAQIRPSYLLTWLPSALTSHSTKTRTYPFRFALPIFVRWHNQVQIPFGYTLRKLPSDQVKTFGDLTLKRHAFFRSPGVVEVDYVWKTLKNQLSPAEFEATRTALTQSGNSLDPIRLVFDLEAKKLLESGRFKESFALYRQMIARSPKSPLPLQRYSQVLLNAGFGDLARQTAAKAVQIAPQNAEAWSLLGWTREFDDVGRRFGPGYDRQRAIEAFQKAVSLDPQSWAERANLAILWEYDAEGLRYQKAADLEKAIKQYDHIQSVLKKAGLEINPLIDLWTLGRWQEVLARASRLSKPAEVEAYTLAATAMLSGPKTAIAQADTSLDPEVLRSAFEKAANLLVRARQYSYAADFLRQASHGSTVSITLDVKADALDKTMTASPISAAPRPEDYSLAFVSALVASKGRWTAPFKAIMTPAMLHFFLTSTRHAGFRSEWRAVADIAREDQLPLTNQLDELKTLLKCAVSPVGKDFHVQVTYQGTIAEGWFLRQTPAGYVMIANSHISRSLVAPLRQMIAQKDPATLLWIKDYLTDEYSQRQGAFLLPQLWGTQQHDLATAKLFVDSLEALTATQPGQLEACRADFAQQTGDVRLDLGLVLAEGLNRINQAPEALTILENLNKQYPQKTEKAYEAELFFAGQYQKLRELLTKAWKEQPSDPQRQQRLLDFYLRLPNPAETEAFINSQNLTLNADQANSVAWSELFRTPISPQALTWALQAVSQTHEKDYSYLNTLAAVYAAGGRLDAAHEVFLKSLSATTRRTLIPADWYVVGRIAEGYGLTQEAHKDYQKIPTHSTDPLSESVLAQRRLTLLEVNTHE